MKFDFHTKKTGIALVGYNRLNYFKQVVDSLAPQVGDRSVFVFLDIGQNPDYDIQNEHANYAKEKLPCKVIKHAKHLGCNASMVFARQFMFEYKRFPQAFILGDDVALSPNYLYYCESLMKWAKNNLSYKVGVVQGWNKCKDLGKDESGVEHTLAHHWQFLQTYESWIQIAPLMREYIDRFFTQSDYNNPQNLRKVLMWRNQKLLGMNALTIKKFPKCEHEIKTINSNNPIHDSITQAFLFATNQVRLAPLIGIGKPLGAKGTHFTPEYFYKKGLGSRGG